MVTPFEDNFTKWKVKWELAKQGSHEAGEQIKKHLQCSWSGCSLQNQDFKQILIKSSIRVIKKHELYGQYQLYYQFPFFLLLQGSLQIQCINLEGDDERLSVVDRVGVVEITRQELIAKYGESNINLLTRFTLIGISDSIIIQIPQQLADNKLSQHKMASKCILEPSRELSQKLSQKLSQELSQKLSQKQKMVMQTLFLFPSKAVKKMIIKQNEAMTGQMYLMKGIACYCTLGESTIVLASYSEGYLNPKQFKNQYDLRIVEGSEVVMLEEDQLNQDVVKGLQQKRRQHLKCVWIKYAELDDGGKQKMQKLLMEKLKMEELKMEELKMEKHIQMLFDSRLRKNGDNVTKKQLITTSSSLQKQKCTIRIKKGKKKII